MARTRHGGDARGIGFRKQNQHRGWRLERNSNSRGITLTSQQRRGLGLRVGAALRMLFFIVFIVPRVT